MVKLRVEEILIEKGLSRYWLCKRLEMHYVSFKKMIENDTTAIRFDTLDRMAGLLNVEISDLLVRIPDTERSEKMISDDSFEDNNRTKK